MQAMHKCCAVRMNGLVERGTRSVSWASVDDVFGGVDMVYA